MATIQKRGKAIRYLFSCGYDLNGKQIRRTMTWTPAEGMTKRQTEKEPHRRQLCSRKMRTGQVLDGSIKLLTLPKSGSRTMRRSSLGRATIGSYKEMLPRINAALGYIRIDGLQPHHIISFTIICRSRVRADGKQRCIVDMTALLRSFNNTSAVCKTSGCIRTCADNINRGKNVSCASAERISQALKNTDQ